jgi:uncharacterized cofD-like protein
VALSEDELLMAKLFQYRFSGGGELQGHSFGNLFLTALANVTGDFLEAIRLTSEVLAIKGRILPSTMADVHLVGELENGIALYGESLIGRSPGKIRHISILPEECIPLPEALEAIASADIITMGPGSLYTSLLPNLLVRAFLKLFAGLLPSRFTLNIMTQRETAGFTASDHLCAIREHCDIPFSYFMQQHPYSEEQRASYRREVTDQTKIDIDAIGKYGVQVMFKDLLAEGDKVRHDPVKLAATIFELQCPPNERIRSQPCSPCLRVITMNSLNVLI